MIREQIKWAALGGPNVAARGIILAAKEFDKGSEDIEVSTREITGNVSKILESLQGPIGSTQLNAAVLSLQDMADKLATGDARARALGRELRALVKEIQNVNSLPGQCVIDIEARLDKAGAEREGREGGQIILDALANALGPDGARIIGFDFIENVGRG